ncbi:SDR family NAD(P)-dependent oxidoreductase [Myceligenerans pegani]|uniref:SDR family oxidoreductase n=1 Tax=Myceligenerans pegani TaxID=2776917 RepID=A0ABR9MWP5_9MICO|nr:SDR family NAD(P)-dependent oxidoreductase [Myceligenerans sp. TRM 65318]MBE1875805.1 SDR family oxidoreductase [Myceligenerans sp. TRM 65318]MBE3018076.1 SDR family oxidoreductase [Myceligenerans sp. TRM 65318]
MNFDGRVALVTGAAHGIGAATARRLHDDGATVVLADRDADAAGALAGDLGPRARATACDIHDRESVDAAVGTARAAFGRLDLLVTVAGGSIPTPDPEQLTDETWEQLVDLNLTGTMRCVRAALPSLRESPRPAVVMVSSVNGLAAFGDEPYSAAKAGLSVLAKNYAVRYGPDGIRFNVVAPGTVRTRVWDSQDGALERLTPFYPLGRVGEPEDIAAAVAFLASDDAAWITGVTLPVDGGILAGPLRTMFPER